MVGMTFLVGGYDKVLRLALSGFRDNWLGAWFVEIIHGETTSAHVSAVLPKGVLLLFGYVVPFWELAVGVMVVFGIYRMTGAVMGMLLIAVFLIGGEATHALDYPHMIIEIIQMYVFGFGYFFLYRELCKDPADPLALDRFRPGSGLRSGRDRRSRESSDP